MPSLLIDPSHIQCWSDCVKTRGFAHGVLVGQRIKDDEFVLAHAAVNNLCTAVKGIADIKFYDVAEHWLDVWRMSCGSFSVLGLFTASEEPIIDSPHVVAYIQIFLLTVLKIVQHKNENLLNTEARAAGLLNKAIQKPVFFFVCYCEQTKGAIGFACTIHLGRVKFEVIQCECSEEPIHWYSVISHFGWKGVLPLYFHIKKFNFEKYCNDALAQAADILASQEVCVGPVIARGKTLVEEFVISHSSPQIKKEKLLEYKRRMMKKSVNAIPISSRIWCHGEVNMSDVGRFVRIDIIRSLSIRLGVYIEARNDETFNLGELIANGLPRRIYFNLAPLNSRFKAQASIYAFPFEDPVDMAITEAKNVMNVDLTGDCIDTDEENFTETED